MKTLVVAIALAVVLLCSSTVMAGWAYVAPVRVYSYYPAAPVYAYPQTVSMPVVAAPVYAPAPVVYPYPAVVRTKVYFYGQPVRNVVRAVVP
jgi:hypothetical protein